MALHVEPALEEILVQWGELIFAAGCYTKRAGAQTRLPRPHTRRGYVSIKVYLYQTSSWPDVVHLFELDNRRSLYHRVSWWKAGADSR